GLPMGVLNASTTLGQAMAPPVLTLLMVAYGWRSMFVWIGVLGVAVAVVWFPTYRGPARFTSPRDAEHPGPQPPIWPSALDDKVTLRAWLRLFRQRTLWGMMLGFSGVNYTAWLYLAWVPGYLEAAHHVGLKATGWLAAVPFLMGSAGMLANGVVADGLVRKGRDPLRSRKALIVAGMVCSAACTMLVPRAQTGAGSAAVIGMALFFIHFAGTSAWGLVQTAVPAHLVATVGATQNFCSFVFASAAPVVTGWFLDRTHSFNIALMICAGVTLLGAIAYWWLVKDGISG
ncbi:MAG TPA: MFS transporter, partial [Pseudacidobacterium sp.]|nr:MFS transporter [Pseudacidobacterium sp.]